MKHLIGNFYVEVKGKKYKNRPTENITLRKREEPKRLRTQYPVQNEVKLGKIKKYDNQVLEVTSYKKVKTIVEKTKFDAPCPSCKQQSLTEFNQETNCFICDFFVKKT